MTDNDIIGFTLEEVSATNLKRAMAADTNPGGYMGWTDLEPFGDWCVVELMGRRIVVGYVTESTIAGQAFLRVDRPAVDEQPAVTQFYAPSAVYGLHPSTEDIVRRYAANSRPYEPLHSWELTANTEDEPY